MSLSRKIARPMLASVFIYGGVNALRKTSEKAAQAKPVTDRMVPAAQKALPQIPIPEDAATLVRINAATHIVAGLGLATGRAPRLCAAVLAGSLVPTTIAGHDYWARRDPDDKAEGQQHFVKNISLIGGLIIAAGDTDGKPSVAYRTRRVARDARKEAKGMAKTARREAKLAKATLT